MQAQIVTLDRHRSRVVPLLSGPEAVAELEDALFALDRDLRTMLELAERVSFPKLQNLEAGGSMREFLLPGPLVDEHAPNQPLRDWLGGFMPQVTAVHDRLRTLHYKNLGRLLALRERIEAVDGDCSRG